MLELVVHLADKGVVNKLNGISVAGYLPILLHLLGRILPHKEPNTRRTSHQGPTFTREKPRPC